MDSTNEGQFEYRFEEWIADWGNVVEASLTTPEERLREYWEKLFQSRYTNPKEAYWRHLHLATAYVYLQQNAESLEKAGWMLRSSKGSIPNPHLVVVLYRAFGNATEEHLNHPPNPQVIAAAAEEQRKLNG